MGNDNSLDLLADFAQAKILPLRLHVDQDALDFLKKFFSFKDPDSVVTEPSEPSEEIFFRTLISEDVNIAWYDTHHCCRASRGIPR